MRRRLRRPSPLHRVAESFRLWLIGSTYRPFGRRRASPVTSQDHFHQVAARLTPVVHLQRSACLEVGRAYGCSSALRSRAVSGAPRRPKMLSPGVALPGPFVTSPSPGLPVATCWLLTSVDRCGVRARRSVQVRSRTGRLQRIYPPFIASPFLLEVYLVPSRCGSRTLKGLNPRDAELP